MTQPTVIPVWIIKWSVPNSFCLLSLSQPTFRNVYTKLRNHRCPYFDLVFMHPVYPYFKKNKSTEYIWGSRFKVDYGKYSICYETTKMKKKKQISGRHNNADRCYAFKMQNGKAFMPLRCFLKKTMLYIKAHVHRLIDWSYIVLRPVLERIFHSDRDVIIADNGLPNLGICSLLTALSSYRNPYSTIPAMGCMVSPQ